FTVDAFPRREFSGRVRQVRLSATNTQNVITYPVIVSVDNPDGSLLPGMTANAEIEVSQRQQVLRVPNAALRYRPADAPAQRQAFDQALLDHPSARQATLWRLADGRPQPVTVRVGVSDSRHAEVHGEGLAEGDQVIIGEEAAG